MLQIEGVSVEALVDTGAPVSIVNLKFLLVALAKNKNQEQSPEEWREEVEKRLSGAALLHKPAKLWRR